MKPVELVERAVENSSRPGDTVLDPFAGSGTTLIACERRRRRARLIEVDPRYADVICERWEQYSGKPAIRNADGVTFAELAEERQQRDAAYPDCRLRGPADPNIPNTTPSRNENEEF
jgi:DNA modification methylase